MLHLIIWEKMTAEREQSTAHFIHSGARMISIDFPAHHLFPLLVGS